MLQPSLKRSVEARVINVASASQSGFDVDDLIPGPTNGGITAYSRSKLMNVMHSLDMAAGSLGFSVTSASLHPGTYLDTNMVRAAGGTPMTPVDTGADAVIALVDASKKKVAGRYFNVRSRATAHPQAYDSSRRKLLRDLALSIVD